MPQPGRKAQCSQAIVGRCPERAWVDEHVGRLVDAHDELHAAGAEVEWSAAGRSTDELAPDAGPQAEREEATHRRGVAREATDDAAPAAGERRERTCTARRIGVRAGAAEEIPSDRIRFHGTSFALRAPARQGRPYRSVPSSTMASRHIRMPPAGDDPLVATGRTLRWGVVSTGSIAHEVTRHLVQLEDARLHAVSSRSRDRAEAFARSFGADRAYGDDGDTPGYEQLVADPDVDVVYVATPHGQHHQVTRAALAAGKGVLVEKSITVTAWEAEELARLARDRGAFAMEAVWTRFLPIFQAALDVVASGELGELRWVQADLGFPARGDRRRRLWAPEDGGGALLDLTVYPLTWAIGALGFPDDVHATGVLTDEGVDELNALTLTYAGGARAQLLSTLASQATRTATLAGTEGTLRTTGSLTNPTSFVVTRGDEQREVAAPPGRPRYAYQLREVTRCVQEGLLESPTMPLADSVATMRLFDRARAQLGVRYPHDR
jgi:predicted dehydrogenase